MRKSIAATALLVSCVVLPSLAKDSEPASEPPKGADGLYAYEAVVAVEGVPAAELYSRAKAWAAGAYRSLGHVTQLDDKEAGRLVLKGNFSVKWGIPGFGGEYLPVTHSLTIETRDGRYRYVLTDLVMEYPSTVRKALEDKDAGSPYRKKFLARTCDRAEAMISDLKSAMGKPAEKW